MNINTSVIAAITIGILGACVLPKINNAVVFYPKQIHVNELNKLSQKYAKHIELCDFNIKKDKLYGCLINISRRPSWNDTIFLYSHGNSGWFGQLTTYPQIAELSKYGSIFLYDYRLICNNSTFILIKGHLKYRLQMILISFSCNQCLTLMREAISDSCSVGCIKMKAVAIQPLDTK